MKPIPKRVGYYYQANVSHFLLGLKVRTIKTIQVVTENRGV